MPGVFDTSFLSEYPELLGLKLFIVAPGGQ